MNQSTAFRRKIIYLVVLIAMLVPLFLLGHPSDGSARSGGQLALMREEFGISESDLGEISPASETMKLASLGLRGVAATLLWEKAHEYRILHEWDRLKAALNNIALLQPHYDKVWEHQAHNLAYNVSIEFDDYRQRYEMVREGTEFLTRGVRQNQKAPRLIWYTGWFYGQKMGMSDEKRQFRRLFANDTILHESLNEEGIAVEDALGPLGKPDNWLVGREWLNHGYEIVDAGVKIRRQTPLNFFETGPKWSFKHAEAIESEGILDQNAEVAWTKASEDWERFGERSIPTTASFTIKLGRIEDLQAEATEKRNRFKELAGDLYEKAEQEKIDQLQPHVRKVWDKAPEDRTEAGKKLIPNVVAFIRPDFTELAAQMPKGKQVEALELISELKDLDERINKTEGYRKQINYLYWESLALAEQEERTVRARRLIYEAEKLNADAELDQAIEKYESAFAIFAEIFDDYPILTIDDSAEDLFLSIRRYMIAIDSEDLPKEFPLKTFAEMMMREDGIVAAEQYEVVRKEQKALADRRQKELEEEERRRETEAMEAEKKAAEERAAAEKKAEMEKAEKEKAAAEKEMKKEQQSDSSDEKGDDATKDASKSDEKEKMKNEPAEEKEPDKKDSEKKDQQAEKKSEEMNEEGNEKADDSKEDSKEPESKPEDDQDAPDSKEEMKEDPKEEDASKEKALDEKSDNEKTNDGEPDSDKPMKEEPGDSEPGEKQDKTGDQESTEDKTAESKEEMKKDSEPKSEDKPADPKDSEAEKSSKEASDSDKPKDKQQDKSEKKNESKDKKKKDDSSENKDSDKKEKAPTEADDPEPADEPDPADESDSE